MGPGTGGRAVSRSGMSTPEYATEEIRKYALLEGFDVVGFTSAETDGDLGARLDDFLKAGFHGDMGWLSTHASRRRSPQGLWAETKSVIVLGTNYGPDHLPHNTWKTSEEVVAISPSMPESGLSRYPQETHETDWPLDLQNLRCDVKVFVDTAPV